MDFENIPYLAREAEGLLEKNTEAVLKAARLGDTGMLADLHAEVGGGNFKPKCVNQSELCLAFDD